MALVNGELGEKEVVPEEFHVGREFCLQYYTILTKNTGHIHRFYDEDSQMTRGSSEIMLTRSGGEIEPQFPARGQKEIHARMMEENLRNAKVKVLHFDVQKVAGDHQLLAIQVCGELTNDDGPMRRFMESFVLKRTDAKKCYVVNNIFRYQDQVFCNGIEECSGSDTLNNTGVSEGTGTSEPTINEVPVSDNLNSQSAMAAASGDEDGCREMVNEPPAIVEDPANVHLGSMTDETELPKTYEAMDTEIIEMPSNKVEDIDSKQDETEIEEKEEEPDTQEDTGGSIEGANGTENGRTNNQSQGGRSWANLVRQGIPSNTSPKSPNAASGRARPATTTNAPPAVQPVPINTIPDTIVTPSISSNVETTRPPKAQRESTPITNVGDTNSSSPGSLSTEKVKFPDNVQVFVGNIPINMKSEVLKEFFNNYGEVVDVRINVSKSNGRLPNFGFVIFKSPETVQNVLTKRPIYIDSHRLNVEEKKPNGNRGPRQPIVSGGPGGPPRNGFGPRPRRA